MLVSWLHRFAVVVREVGGVAGGDDGDDDGGEEKAGDDEDAKGCHGGVLLDEAELLGGVGVVGAGFDADVVPAEGAVFDEFGPVGGPVAVGGGVAADVVGVHVDGDGVAAAEAGAGVVEAVLDDGVEVGVGGVAGEGVEGGHCFHRTSMGNSARVTRMMSSAMMSRKNAKRSMVCLPPILLRRSRGRLGR